jgi:hypothetical protein
MKALCASGGGPLNGEMRLFLKPLINGKETVIFRMQLPVQLKVLFVKTSRQLTQKITEIASGLIIPGVNER